MGGVSACSKFVYNHVVSQASAPFLSTTTGSNESLRQTAALLGTLSPFAYKRDGEIAKFVDDCLERLKGALGGLSKSGSLFHFVQHIERPDGISMPYEPMFIRFSRDEKGWSIGNESTLMLEGIVTAVRMIDKLLANESYIKNKNTNKEDEFYVSIPVPAEKINLDNDLADELGNGIYRFNTEKNKKLTKHFVFQGKQYNPSDYMNWILPKGHDEDDLYTQCGRFVFGHRSGTEKNTNYGGVFDYKRTDKKTILMELENVITEEIDSDYSYLDAFNVIIKMHTFAMKTKGVNEIDINCSIPLTKKQNNDQSDEYQIIGYLSRKVKIQTDDNEREVKLVLDKDKEEKVLIFDHTLLKRDDKQYGDGQDVKYTLTYDLFASFIEIKPPKQPKFDDDDDDDDEDEDDTSEDENESQHSKMIHTSAPFATTPVKRTIKIWTASPSPTSNSDNFDADPVPLFEAGTTFTLPWHVEEQMKKTSELPLDDAPLSQPYVFKNKVKKGLSPDDVVNTMIEDFRGLHFSNSRALKRTVLALYNDQAGGGSLKAWLDQPVSSEHRSQAWAVDCKNPMTGDAVLLGTLFEMHEQSTTRATDIPMVARVLVRCRGPGSDDLSTTCYVDGYLYRTPMFMTIEVKALGVLRSVASTFRSPPRGTKSRNVAMILGKCTSIHSILLHRPDTAPLFCKFMMNLYNSEMVGQQTRAGRNKHALEMQRANLEVDARHILYFA